MELLALFKDTDINPDKHYYKIGDISKLLKVKPSVIRYWEKEFGVKPMKTTSNQRLYKRDDVSFLSDVKQLLYHEKYTIKGAIKKLRGTKKDNKLKLYATTEVPQTFGVEKKKEPTLKNEILIELKAIEKLLLARR